MVPALPRNFLLVALAAVPVLVAPTSAAAEPGSSAPVARHHHATGVKVPALHEHRQVRTAVPLHDAGFSGLRPSSYSLEGHAPAPGDQKSVNSCVSWAIDYSAMGVLESEQNVSGGPNAPMYTYSQLVHGQNVGTSVDDTLDIAQGQGVDAMSHYWQGNYDYRTLPDSGERSNARKWRISGYNTLNTGNALRAEVESAISSGLPVIFSFDFYQSFSDMSADTARDYSYFPEDGERPDGSHEVTIVGYTSRGVRVENSWGTGWGDGGFVNLSWDYLALAALDAHSVGKLVRA
ncbi:C1 family peptidase [Amycolatopsis minnesotensis]|uniref:Peptidase C1A papain C-terminal domain-containing protein n=1 Tax=Amycolatopsis minnesotensis TaxID=337894 RepID=A0ABP5BC69_9PSEU